MSISPLNMSLDTKETKEAGKTGPSSFSNIFADALNTVNDSQWKAGEMSNKLVSGTLESTHEMQIAGAKAEVMLHLTTQIASKLSSATTQLFQMQL